MCVKMERSPLKYKNIACFMVGLYVGYSIVFWLSVSVLRRHMENCAKLYSRSNPEITEDIVFPEQKDQFLLVAVMTTRKYLKTRAEAIYRTWGQKVPGSLVFFVGGTAPYHGHLPVIILENITENAYPPQKKSFAMLKYVSEHFLDDYEWFMRADDDVFVKTGRLEGLLRSINSSKTLYMGQPGTGTQEEAGKLGLHDSSPYCMGGPGVFFTRSALRQIRPHLSSCLLNAVTLHEDTELGRCVQIHAGIACSNAFEFAQLFYQNYRNKSGSFTHKLGVAEERAITLHPIKDHRHMFRLADHFAFSKFNNLRWKIKKLTTAVATMSDAVNKKGNLEGTKLKPSEIRKRLRQLNGWKESGPPRGKAHTHKKYLERKSESRNWDFVENQYLYSLNNRFQNPVQFLSCVGKVISFTKSKNCLSVDSKYNRKDLTFLSFSYQRLSHGQVMENIHILENRRRSSSTSVRTVQQFGRMEYKEESTPTSNHQRTIWIILPLYKRSRLYAAFLSMVTRTLESFDGVIKLCVVVYVDDKKEHVSSQHHSDMLNTFVDKLHIKVLPVNGQFSRAKAITHGINNLKGESLILIMDVDMVFNAGFLNRVITNTKLKKQAYFPIYFSKYDPHVVCFENKSCEIDEINFENQFGTWRFFSYGIVSIYKSDIQRVNGFKMDIKGWGKEDVDFFEKCLKSHLNVFRATDPFLVHVYHPRDCAVSLPGDQMAMCVQSRNQLYGSHPSLYKMTKKLKLLPV